ncbi:1-propanol dehydrogenase PduQ [Clostridium sp. Cult2]|uniref:1-propanol dehydrogenase PduQ n=1 Tax=Clostridium sp. Cult2 TaxID=2079003 RepID=UPI001F46E764|nr:1-propanol dehydrogenase PduQ [Clostridium sp. Cult2]MCF6466277.1 alcohol dehydrogenase [Clostridium sp. Cult2]
MRNFNLKTDIYYGLDSIQRLKDINIKKAFIVTDNVMIKLGNLAEITYILDKKSIDWCLFNDVAENPSLESVYKGLEEFIGFRSDTIIALGGGSVIDTGKAILYYYLLTLEKLIDRDLIKKPSLIAIPTTSGTGSEVTSYSVLTDTKTERKIPIMDNRMIPDIAILDNQFTKTIPSHVIADTGFDVLTHAIEAYVAINASDYTDTYAEKAIKYVFSYLLRAYYNEKDLEAREKMQIASCMAGIAFTNSGLGVNHSIAHIIGARFGIPHGRINGILLPYVVEFNSELDRVSNSKTSKKYRHISKSLGFPHSTPRKGVVSLIEGIKILKDKLNIPATLKEANIDSVIFYKSLEEMSNIAMEDLCTKSNPIKIKNEQIINILKKAYTG